MKKFNKKYILMFVLSIFFSVTVLLGGSYALIQKVLVGTNTYAMRTGNFLVEFKENEEITLSNQVPVYDNVGMSTGDEFTFSVSNTGNYVSSYSIKIEQLSTDDLSNVVRYAIDYGNGYSYDNIHTLANNKYIIQNKSLAINGIDSYKLRFWLDIDASEEYINKEFAAKVVIEATQDEYKYGTNILQSVYNLEEVGAVAIGTDGQLYTEGDIREYRYAGVGVNNYVWFNCEDGYTSGSEHCEKWRIIGGLENTYENGVASYRMLKIVKDEPLANQLPFNSNEGNLANFEGSSIQKYLNETYYNSLNQSAKDFSIKARWNIGEALENNDANSNYLIEKSVISYNYVGLINVSDYGYAQKMNLSWINEFGTLLINPSLMTGKNVYYMSEIGLSKGSLTTDSYNVRPSMYLKPDVSIIAGYGTIEEPYELAIKFPIEYGVKTEPKAHEIIYNLNGAAGNIKPTIIGDNITTEVPVREHYSFLGWNTNPHATEAEYQGGDSYTGNAVTLYAVWKGDEYEITLNPNGGTVTASGNWIASGSNVTNSFEYSSAIGTLPTPTRTGYVFNGWYTAASGGTQILESTIVTGTETYYAQWNEKTLYIYFNANDGAVTAETDGTYTKDSSGFVLKNGSYLTHNVAPLSQLSSSGLTNPDNTSYLYITKTGYSATTGAEWNTKADGTGTGYDDSVAYTYEQLITSAIDNGDHYRLNLYVNWKGNSYTVTYIDYSKNLFTASGKTQSGITSAYTASSNVLTLNGTPSSSHTISYINNSTYSVGDKYLIKVDYVSGTLTNTNSQSVWFALDVVDSTQSLLSTRLYVSPTAPTSSIKTQSKILTINSLGASNGKYLRVHLTYSAVAGLKFTNYKVNIYVLKLSSKSITYGSAYGTLPTPTRSGYTFAGWYTAETGGTKVTSSTIVSTNSNHNLYARWTAN